MKLKTKSRHIELRKIKLIDEVNRIKCESELRQLEIILKKAKPKNKSSKRDFSKFVGLLTNKEADEMQLLITNNN